MEHARLKTKLPFLKLNSLTNTHTFSIHLKSLSRDFPELTDWSLSQSHPTRKLQTFSLPSEQDCFKIQNNIDNTFTISASEVFYVHTPYSGVIHVFGEGERHL